jgi:hypothetical protein
MPIFTQTLAVIHLVKLIIIISLFCTIATFGQSDISVSVSFPQNSGIVGVDYKVYSITNGNFYVIKSRFNLSAIMPDSLRPQNHSTEQYLDDTISVHGIKSSVLIKLEAVLNETNTLGDHDAKGCLFQMGWPRFFITTQLNGLKMTGSISNCYRENIFNIIDVLNLAVPNVKVLEYNIPELISLEKKCGEHNYGRDE